MSDSVGRGELTGPCAGAPRCLPDTRDRKLGGHGTQKADQEGGVPPMRKTHSFVVLMVGLVLALTACGGDDDSSSQASSPTASAKGELTVGGANFTEMLIMQQMYKLLLEKAGFTVKVQSVDNRELYAPALRSGDIDVVPEYLATMTEYLNHAKNGPDAPTIATSDAAETVNLAKPTRPGLRPRRAQPGPGD